MTNKSKEPTQNESSKKQHPGIQNLPLKTPRTSSNLLRTSLTMKKGANKGKNEAQTQEDLEKIYLQAFNDACLAVEEGDPKALVKMGRFYEEGVGTDTNFDDAIMYYAKAAVAGEGSGWFNLGVCHRLGIGTKVDLEKAFRCFKNAAEKGLPRAYVNLAACYKSGVGTERDLQKAREYYKKALAFDECQDKAQEGYRECQRLIKKNEQLNKQRSSFLLKELFSKAQVTNSHIEVNITYIDRRPSVKR